MKKKIHLMPFWNKYLAGLTLAVLFLLSAPRASAREAMDTIIPSSITARPTWNGAVDSAWFIADVTSTQTRKVSGSVVIQRAVKYIDTTQMLANYLSAINSHSAQLASHLSSINLNTAAIALINVQLPKKVDSVRVNGSTLYYYANGGIAYPAGTVTTSGGTATTVPWTGITGTPTTIAGYGITDAYTRSQIATVGTTGSYTDLLNKPTIPAAQVNSDWNSSTGLSQILNKPALDSTGISGYHTTGFYDNRYLVPINANTAGINTINSYYNGSVIKSTSLPIGSASALGAYKVGSGLAVDGTGVLSATGGTTFNLNNEQYYGVKWVSGQTFTMPNTPTKFYWVQIIGGSSATSLYGSYSWTSGTSVTVNETLNAGDSLVFHYDIGTANGTIASGTPSTGYVPIWNGTTAVWGAQSGGGTGGPTSISLATPNVLYSTPITYTNDGSGNWTGTLSLISQAAHKVFASPLASTGTPSFRYIDSADFGATGQFATEVQAVPGFGTGGGGGNYAPKDLTLNLQTASYTAALSDDGVFVRMNLASAGTFTIPTHASVALPVGAQINVVQSGAGQITITPAGGVTINSADGATKTRVQYSSCTLLQAATDTWLLLGDITN